MIEWMRKHMVWMMWTIVALITVTFLFFGVYPSSESGSRAAKVGDHVITTEEVNRVYQNLRDTYKDIMKDQKTDVLERTLRQQALQELVVNRLFLDEAEHRGLHVTNEELQAAIVKMPAFQVNGRFDKLTYDRVLERINMSPAVFENAQRELLLRQKLEHLIRDSVAVNDAEIKEAYFRQNPKATGGDFEKNRATFGQTYLAGKQRDALTAALRVIQERVSVKIDDKSLAAS